MIVNTDEPKMFSQAELDAAIGKRLGRLKLHKANVPAALLAAAEDVRDAHHTETARQAWAAERETPPGYLGDTPTAIPPADAARPCSSRDRDDIPFLGEAA